MNVRKVDHQRRRIDIEDHSGALGAYLRQISAIHSSASITRKSKCQRLEEQVKKRARVKTRKHFHRNRSTPLSPHLKKSMKKNTALLSINDVPQVARIRNLLGTDRCLKSNGNHHLAHLDPGNTQSYVYIRVDEGQFQLLWLYYIFLFIFKKRKVNRKLQEVQ